MLYAFTLLFFCIKDPNIHDNIHMLEAVYKLLRHCRKRGSIYCIYPIYQLRDYLKKAHRLEHVVLFNLNVILLFIWSQKVSARWCLALKGILYQTMSVVSLSPEMRINL